MDEENSESVDTSPDMDVSDVDMSDDVPADIPDDIPEDVPEDDYSDADISDDVSEDVSEEPADDDIEYDETDESIEEDSIEPENDELDESIDDIEEDSLEESEDTTEDYEELNDIPEDTNGFDEEQTDEVVDDTEEIPEDTDDYEVTDREEAIDEDIPEDVSNAETTDETADVEDTDTAEQPEDVTDTETTDETSEVSETPEINSISDYMNAHNYGPDDFATYSQDPQWRQLMRQEYPDYELPEMTRESANAQLSQYMNDHNYGVDDYAKYSQDPVWRELHSTAFPDDELPPINDAAGKQDMEYPSAESDGIDDLNPPEDNNERGSNPPKTQDDIDESQLFGSFETDKHINGSDSFVKGDNYEQFKKDYYAPEESSYETYDVPKEVDISPSMIEGIHLGERELENPDIFWSQHEKDGTLESFTEVASHIPDVREQLASGKTIDELLSDPELSECAGIYFANKPKVIENDGYYEFDSNGRHRILAAREARYDIPVEVIGRRSRNDGTESRSIDSDVEELHANIGGGELSEQPVGENKEFGSFSDKIRNFFTPAEDADLIEPGTVDLPEPMPDVRTKWTPPAIKGVDVKEPEADITPLDSTRQTINFVDLPDGSKARVFDHPNDLRNVLPFSQGKNEYSKSGTCALADTGTWLKVAGSKHVENDVVGFASTHTDRRGQPLCSKSGGTLPSNIPDIWEHFGMPAYSDGSKNLENIAEAVESGRAVSVGVNAGTLWEQDNTEGIKIPQNCYGDGGANHAIGIMSCERDPISGNITHFYINDTGRTYERDACRRISISDFWKAFNVKRACATISQKPVW